MIAETHKKAKTVLCKDIFPWQNHSDNLNINCTHLNEDCNDCGNSHNAEIVPVQRQFS